MSTPAQIEANRANAQFSTGPRTEEGKAKVAHNAVKTALTGATVLLPTDDAALYEQHVANVFAAWTPETHREKLLVQSIADSEWRLQRIPALEAAVLALGRSRHADQFPNDPMLLEAYLQETYARNLRNLQLQEARLRRHRAADVTELEALQTERRKRRAQQLNAAIYMYRDFQHARKPFNPAEFGFEFSLAEIELAFATEQAKSVCRYPEQMAKMQLREQKPAA